MTPTYAPTIPQFAKECILESFRNSIAQYEGETRANLLKFVARISGYCLYTICDPKMVRHVRDDVFSQSSIRDFMMSMTSNFFFRFGDNEEDHARLVNHIANAIVMVDLPKSNVRDSLIPEEMVQRLPSLEQVQTVLQREKWLVVVILTTLNMTLREAASLTNT